MPLMGTPPEVKAKNPYKGVKMARRAPKKNAQGDVFNKMGVGSKSNKELFVDQKTHNKMGKDEFLKLLSHQLQNQDPMNPMEQKDFAADLAQFAQLEQMSNMNSKMGKMNQNAPTESKFMAASFLGKQVYTQGTSIDYNGRPTDLNFNLEKEAAQVKIRVVDNKGSTVAEIDRENLGRGPQTIVWDGIRMDGIKAGKGKFALNVMAWDKNFMPIEVKTSSAGTVSAVHFENGATILTLSNGKRVSLDDVSKFEDPSVKKERKSIFDMGGKKKAAQGNPAANAANLNRAMNNLKSNGGKQQQMNAKNAFKGLKEY